jgi:hypothetical protein
MARTRRNTFRNSQTVDAYVERITQREQTFDMERETEVPELHGQRDGRAVIEVCEGCGYAYSNGGYCPIGEGGCGRTAETIVHSYGSVVARKW